MYHWLASLGYKHRDLFAGVRLIFYRLIYLRLVAHHSEAVRKNLIRYHLIEAVVRVLNRFGVSYASGCLPKIEKCHSC
ncbi:MAG: hypothetical protein ACI9WS_003072 [Paraglaciecola psychrophila]